MVRHINPYTGYYNYHSTMSSSNRGSGSSGWAPSHHSSTTKPLIPKANPSGDSPDPASGSGPKTVAELTEAPAPEPAPEPANGRPSESSSESSSGGPLLGSMYPQVPPVPPKFPSKMQRWMDKYTYWKTARQLKKEQWVTLFVLLYPGNWRDNPHLQSKLEHNFALGLGWDEPFNPKCIVRGDCFEAKLTEEEARAMAEEDRIRAKRARKEHARLEKAWRKEDERIAREMREIGMEMVPREEGLEAISEEDFGGTSEESLEHTSDEDWENLKGAENEDEQEEDEEDDESLCLWDPAGKALENGDRCRCRLSFEHRIYQTEIPSVGKPLSRIAVARVKGFTMERLMELLLSVPVNSADGGNAGWRWIFYVLRKLREDIALGRVTNTPGAAFPDPPSGGLPPAVALPLDPKPCYLEICPELRAQDEVTITGKLAVWENFLRNEGLIAEGYQRRNLKPPKRNINWGLRRE